MQLEDNGNGLVDLTQNDGIYSAVFPYVGQLAGFYSVQVIADDNDQQAMVPKETQSAHISKSSFRISDLSSVGKSLAAIYYFIKTVDLLGK